MAEVTPEKAVSLVGRLNVHTMRTAYREAKRLIAGAGIMLASAGLPVDAPELKLLREVFKALDKREVV